MDTLVLIIGGNLGDRCQNISTAYHSLVKVFGNVRLKSAVYETEPWGGKSSGKYLNQVLTFNVSKDELDILQCIQNIENSMGRTRNVKWGNRTMDIDILFLSDKIINRQTLQIPHPYIQDRRFVLKPLNEILPDYIHPAFKKSIRDLLHECADESDVRIFSEN